MYKSEQAWHAIRNIKPNVNTNWLEMHTVNTHRTELTKDDNSQMTKSFSRVLIAANRISIELLDDWEM